MPFPSLTVHVSLYFGFRLYKSQVCRPILIDFGQHFSLPTVLLE